jgi:hypothetical protein
MSRRTAPANFIDRDAESDCRLGPRRRAVVVGNAEFSQYTLRLYLLRRATRGLAPQG